MKIECNCGKLFKGKYEQTNDKFNEHLSSYLRKIGHYWVYKKEENITSRAMSHPIKYKIVRKT